MRQLDFSPKALDLRRKINRRLAMISLQAKASRYWIYVIRDPLAANPRKFAVGDPIYVGQTSNPVRRLTAHLTAAGQASGKGAAPLYRRLYSALASGRVPCFELVEQAGRRLEALAGETRWAQRMLSEGFRLLQRLEGASGADRRRVSRQAWSTPQTPFHTDHLRSGGERILPRSRMPDLRAH